MYNYLTRYNKLTRVYYNRYGGKQFYKIGLRSYSEEGQKKNAMNQVKECDDSSKRMRFATGKNTNGLVIFSILFHRLSN